MLIIPAMDLIDNQVVRLEQGDYQKKTVFSDNIIETAHAFKKAGFKRLHLVDLSGAKAGKPEHASVIGKVASQLNMTIEAGGGIRTVEDFDLLYNSGLDRSRDFVMIGSLPFKNRPVFDQILDDTKGNVLLTVDVWGEEVKISGWQEATSVNLFTFLQQMIDAGIQDFLVTQIKKDGMLAGPDFELYEKILEQFSSIRLIASGGVASVEDLQKLSQIKNLYGAILGKAYYSQRIPLSDPKLKSLLAAQ